MEKPHFRLLEDSSRHLSRYPHRTAYYNRRPFLRVVFVGLRKVCGVSVKYYIISASGPGIRISILHTHVRRAYVRRPNGKILRDIQILLTETLSRDAVNDRPLS
jgi:hypothetical protein